MQCSLHRNSPLWLVAYSANFIRQLRPSLELEQSALLLLYLILSIALMSLDVIHTSPAQHLSTPLLYIHAIETTFTSSKFQAYKLPSQEDLRKAVYSWRLEPMWASSTNVDLRRIGGLST